MRDGGRLSAAISVLSSVLENHEPTKAALRRFAREARYAGSGDRAVVSGLVMDALRRRMSLTAAMEDGCARALILATATRIWKWDATRTEAACRDEYGPEPLSADETKRLAAPDKLDMPDHIAGDYPEWLAPSVTRAFDGNAVANMHAMKQRAPVDIRVNSIKTGMERAKKALAPVCGVIPLDDVLWGIRIAAPDPEARRPAPDALPAFSRGWIEVQDLGSQIATAAVAATSGEQILDYCAGGGGKTLALAAAMNGRGQVHAYDIDTRRLSAIIPRLKRSGAHNVQIYAPHESKKLGLMDAVLVDVPCSGTGAWRRRPESKWRLTPSALARRCEQQDSILNAAAAYVRPGGRLIYVTCSILPEENGDRIDCFLRGNSDFTRADTAKWAVDSGLLTAVGAEHALRWLAPDMALYLNPLRSGSDGFFIAGLQRSNS